MRFFLLDTLFLCLCTAFQVHASFDWSVLRDGVSPNSSQRNLNEQETSYVQVGRDANFRIPEDFQGLSMEYGVFSFFQKFQIPDPKNPSQTMTVYPFVELLRKLKKGTLRIGGASQEYICSQKANSKLCTNEITREFLDKLFEVSQATNWPLLLGLPLADKSDPSAFDAAVKDTTQLMKEMVWAKNARPGSQILALELGNEPDWAYYNGEHPRPSGYTYVTHAEETKAFIRAFKGTSEASGLDFTGPAAATFWRPAIDKWLDALQGEKSAMKYVTLHMYELYTSRPPVTIPRLLSNAEMDADSNDGVMRFQDWLEKARSRGLQMRIAEMNSVNNCGVEGLSDTMAGAVWTLDALFRYAKLGISSVNLHMSNGCPYNSIIVYPDKLVPARAPFYGHLMFAQAAGDYFVQSQVQTNANIRVYTTKSANENIIKVFLLNKIASDENGSGPAHNVRLLAPNGAQWAQKLVMKTTCVDTGACAPWKAKADQILFGKTKLNKWGHYERNSQGEEMYPQMEDLQIQNQELSLQLEPASVVMVRFGI